MTGKKIDTTKEETVSTQTYVRRLQMNDHKTDGSHAGNKAQPRKHSIFFADKDRAFDKNRKLPQPVINLRTYGLTGPVYLPGGMALEPLYREGMTVSMQYFLSTCKPAQLPWLSSFTYTGNN